MQRRSKLHSILDFVPRWVAVRALVASAERSRDSRQWERAAGVFQELAKIAPQHVPFRVQLGNMLKDSGRYEEARENYDFARLLRPDDADIWLQLGHLSKLEGRLGEAARCYRRSAELDPLRGDAQRELDAIVGAESVEDWSRQARRPDTRRSAFVSAAGPALVFERLRAAFETRPE